MSGLYVIEERDRYGVGLARTGLSRSDADRLCVALAAAYPAMRYSVQPQKMEGRGKGRRVAYPVFA